MIPTKTHQTNKLLKTYKYLNSKVLDLSVNNLLTIRLHIISAWLGELSKSCFSFLGPNTISSMLGLSVRSASDFQNSFQVKGIKSNFQKSTFE